MKGPWHYTEAERLLVAASETLEESPDETVGALLQRALVHATLAAAAASTVHAFFDDDEPELWAQAFNDDDGPDDAIVETPEQSAAIVDTNLSRMGATLGGEAEIFDGQQGDLQQAYVRNRAEGRDPVESAARAIVGLT